MLTVSALTMMLTFAQPTVQSFSSYEMLNTRVEMLGELGDRLNEASGIAVSRADSDRIWLINDSGADQMLDFTHVFDTAQGIVKAYRALPSKHRIYNVTSGERFNTYAIRAEEGSGVISVNGAAAHKARPQDRVIICAYVGLDQNELATFKPTLVYLDDRNRISRIGNAIPVQAA